LKNKDELLTQKNKELQQQMAQMKKIMLEMGSAKIPLIGKKIKEYRKNKIEDAVK